MEGKEYILELKNISKSFSGVKALDNVSLLVKRGEIHALVGENGAGKSTLMKILAGIYTKDSGEMLLRGVEFSPKKPIDALEKGIAMVHQELEMIPDMTVVDNVFAGRELTKGIFADARTMRKKTEKIMEDLGIDIDPNIRTGALSTAKQQMVAIVRALAFNAEVIIMDEPTSAITDREVEHLFEILRRLKEQGKAIIYISHKMDELYELTDRITVLRDGQLIGSVDTKDVTEQELVHMMVGRDLKNVFIKDSNYTKEFDKDEILLQVKNLTRSGEFNNISFEVKRGEILGIFGLMGAGRTEVMDTIFGVRKADSGMVLMKNRPITSIKDSMKEGLAYITEDRRGSGLNLISSVKNNLTMAYIDEVLDRGFVVNAKKEKDRTDAIINELRIKCSSSEMLAGNLSGGNQQKIVIGKWFLGNPELLIMDEPTRGIDVSAKAEIYKLMNEFVNSGKSIIMVSSETPELLGMSDRIVIMHEGKKTGEFSKGELTQDEIMAYAIGSREQKSVAS